MPICAFLFMAPVLMEFSWLNSLKPKKYSLFVSTFISFTQRENVNSILFPHITATHGFKSLSYVSESEASSKVRLWLQILAWPHQNFLSMIRHVPSCRNASWQGRGGFFLKEKKIKKWAPIGILQTENYGALRRNKCFGTANPSALSHSNSVRWSQPSTAKICHVIEHRDRFPASQDIGSCAFSSYFTGKGLHCRD